MQCSYYYVQTEQGTYAAKIGILAYARQVPFILPTEIAKNFFGLGGNFFADIQSSGDCQKMGSVPFSVTISTADSSVSVVGWFLSWQRLGVQLSERLITAWQAAEVGGRLVSWKEFGHNPFQTTF